MQLVLVSSCLLGEPARYDGSVHFHEHVVLRRWQAEERIVSVCPEMAGGLPVPRPAAEINAQSPPFMLPDGQMIGRVMNTAREDVTAHFVHGAAAVVTLARQKNIRMAVFKERSPSCGSSIIYDGSFQGNQIPGAGITTQLLRKAGIRVFSEFELFEADEYLCRLSDNLFHF